MGEVGVLRDARDRAGLSQRQLAERAGTSQAMVARIEGGRQSPSMATLERLVRACGLELRVETAGGERAPVETAPAEVGSGRLLVWRAGGGIFAFPLAAVERIVELGALHRLPGQEPGAGVVIVEGTAIAAIDGARRLGLDDGGGRAAQVVVVSVGDARHAVLVDRAEVLSGETEIVRPPTGSGAAAFVVGLADVEGEQVVVLDPVGFCGCGSPGREVPQEHAFATQRT
jgi:transcriptional regulator with XRE-family HTH domain